MAAGENKLNSSLYVGDLHPDVTEEDLTETFSRVGPLLSVRLCRDRFSGSSLRYAYVNFWLPCHALAAMKSLNHTVFKGKSIRIMWYEKDPIARKDNNGNLFVKNLDKSITSALLQQIFSKYGTVLSCKVADENGVSKGFGFVQFESENSAIAARSALHDSFLGGKKLYVSKFLRKKERFGEEVDFRSLCVKNLDKDITGDALKAKFSQYGKVSNAFVMKDRKGKSKRFGFVKFDSHEAAKRAMVFLNGEFLGSKNMVVARAVKRSEQTKNSTQVSGLTYGNQIKESNASNVLVKNPISSICEEIFSGNGAVNSAKPIWSYTVSRRLSYASLYPYYTEKALNSLTVVNAEKLPPQPFYASKCLQQLCNSSYFTSAPPLKQLSTFHATSQYQYVAFYPIKAHYIQRSSAAFPGAATAMNRYKYLEMAKDLKGSSPTVKNPRMEYVATPFVASYPIKARCIQISSAAFPDAATAMNRYKYLKMAKDLKVSSPAIKNPRMESSPVTNKARKANMLQPLAQNLQQPRSGTAKASTKPGKAKRKNVQDAMQSNSGIHL